MFPFSEMQYGGRGSGWSSVKPIWSSRVKRSKRKTAIPNHGF